MKTTLACLMLSGLVCSVHGAEPPWEIAKVVVDSAQIAVPKGWRSMDGIRRTMPIHRQGDGIGVPARDETGAPLQIGLTVERFPPATESTETIAQELARGAARTRELELVGKESVQAVELSDQTPATLLITEFIKSGTRRSLQTKLIAKDDEGQIWIVTGFLVGGKDSGWPTPESHLAIWLQAHITSLTLTGDAVDEPRLEAAYRDRHRDGDEDQ